MAKEDLYRYRIFTSFGLTFDILCQNDSHDELWKAILSSKSEKFSEKFFHANSPDNELKIKPSVITALDIPYGTKSITPVESTTPKNAVKVTPNRVVINGPEVREKTSRGAFSRRKQKR